MGVSGLTKLCKNIMKQISIESLSGNTVLVDVQALYKLIIGKYKYARTDSERERVHVDATFGFATRLLSYGINPIFVFDGKAPKEKQSTIISRKNATTKAIEMCKEIENKESSEYAKIVRKSFYLRSLQIDECKQVLQSLGIPVVQSCSEADVQLSIIYQNLKNKKVNVSGIISDDSDLVIQGATILRDFSFKTGFAVEFSAQSTLNYFRDMTNEIRLRHGLSRIECFTLINLVEFAVLMGTDYKPENTKQLFIYGKNNAEKNRILFELFVINDLSVPTMLSFMMEENQLRSEAGMPQVFSIPPRYITKWEIICNIYKNGIAFDPDQLRLTSSEPSIGEIIELMCVKYNFDMHEIVSTISDVFPYETERYIENMKPRKKMITY